MHRTRLKSVPLACLAAFLLLLAACGGGDESDDASGETGNTDGTVVADEDSDGDEGEELTLEDIDGTAAEPEAEVDGDAEEPEASDDGDAELTLDELQEGEGGDDDGGEDRIEVAEAEEDPVDTLLNSLTIFGDCISDKGYDIDTEGVPNQDGSNFADFDPDYLAALQACATSSGILEAFSSIGEANENLTPEQIRERNFGIPVFTECMERLGWEMGELTPDERGLLSNSEFTPPDGGSFFDGGTDAINECRQESEAHVEANYVPEEG